MIGVIVVINVRDDVVGHGIADLLGAGRYKGRTVSSAKIHEGAPVRDYYFY